MEFIFRDCLPKAVGHQGEFGSLLFGDVATTHGELFAGDVGIYSRLTFIATEQACFHRAILHGDRVILECLGDVSIWIENFFDQTSCTGLSNAIKLRAYTHLTTQLMTDA